MILGKKMKEQEAEQLHQLQMNKSATEKEKFKINVEIDEIKTHLDIINAEDCDQCKRR